jgi:hypothetical protein
MNYEELAVEIKKEYQRDFFLVAHSFCSGMIYAARFTNRITDSEATGLEEINDKYFGLCENNQSIDS